MQLCNSGQEFKVLFLVPAEAECKPPKPPKFGHLGLMGIACDTRRLATLSNNGSAARHGVKRGS